jgi:apocytochrome f|tara:strand:+ start:2755 stop:3696 length:942 start_codon:yes stop_codon:yes gene_type:complete
MEKQFRNLICSISTGFIVFSTFLPENAQAYPIYAQQAYANPREANGRIACANCHLAQKPTAIESPSAVLPDTVFETVVKIPYDVNKKQLVASGDKGPLNVGAVVILPEGFKLAPPSRVPSEIKAKNKGVYISPYSSTSENILVVGPILGDKHREIAFPILAPDPAKNPDVKFLKYPIYVGANRGRGQINPNGEKSNNNAVSATTAGLITTVNGDIKTGYEISITGSDGTITNQKVSKGLTIAATEGQVVTKETLITTDPNIGGFGQAETEIVLQNPDRIVGYLVFCLAVVLCQIFLVIKKKQFEKVQAAEMNF